MGHICPLGVTVSKIFLIMPNHFSPKKTPQLPISQREEETTEVIGHDLFPSDPSGSEIF